MVAPNYYAFPPDDSRLKPGPVVSSDMLGPWRLRESLARDDYERALKHGKAKDIETARGAMQYAQRRVIEIEAGLKR